MDKEIEEIAFNFATFIKTKLLNKNLPTTFNILNELIKYLNINDSDSETDKYFETPVFNYDYLFYEFIITNNIKNFNYYLFSNLDRKKIIEYSFILLGKNIV
jgi:hypothetical protein